MIRGRIGRWVDALRAAGVATLTCGVVMGFGGQTWWGPLLLAGACASLCLSTVARWVLDGSAVILRSPLWALGACAILLGIVQLVPWPTALARRFSPCAMHRGVVIDSGVGKEPLPTRVVFAADRPATLRWIAAATVALVLFGVVAHHVDRPRRLLFVWNSIVASYGVCTLVVAIQLLSGCEGAYGLWVPGSAPEWAPSLSDVQSGPAIVRIRSGRSSANGLEPWPRKHVEPNFAIGPLASGAGAYIALAALGLPLLVGSTLDRMAPRGSREPLLHRLRHNGGTAPLLLSVVMCAISGVYVGFLGGLILGVAVGSGVLLVGFLAWRGPGAARAVLAMMVIVFIAIALGGIAGNNLGRPQGVPRLARPGGGSTTLMEWRTAMRIAMRFPVFGVGLGGYAAVEPLYKECEEASTAASSSLLQWAAETGVIGLALLAMAAVWIARQLPRAWKCIHPSNRALAAALLGSLFSFVVLSLVHTTVQYIAAALPAVAIAGTVNRWLAGGTDALVGSVHND
jgi:hypothetical protein